MGMLPSGLPEKVEDGEDLARFLCQRSHFNSTSVKPAAFLPYRGETSVFRHGLKPAKELWKLGADLASSGRNLHGVAIIKASDARKTGLEAVAAEPPPRHAALREWPSHDDAAIQKARQLDIAIALASAAGEPIFKRS